VFTVSIEGPDHATHVTVQEGEVMVRHSAGESRVRAPGSWSSSVNAITPEPSAAEPEPASPAPKPRPSRGDVPRGDNTLSAEAQLLRQGLAAERQGQFSEARSVLSTLLRKYPSSSLAPDARAALERVEARLQR
jgi:TolA-binding protein